MTIHSMPNTLSNVDHHGGCKDSKTASFNFAMLYTFQHLMPVRVLVLQLSNSQSMTVSVSSLIPEFLRAAVAGCGAPGESCKRGRTREINVGLHAWGEPEMVFT